MLTWTAVKGGIPAGLSGSGSRIELDMLGEQLGRLGNPADRRVYEYSYVGKAKGTSLGKARLTLSTGFDAATCVSIADDLAGGWATSPKGTLRMRHSQVNPWG